MATSVPPPDLAVDLDRPEDDDGTTARVLDAALAELTEFGIRRTTVESVAQRAGLARMTVYRRFAGKDALVQAVVVREMRRFLASLATSVRSSKTVPEALENGFVAGLSGYYTHPFARRGMEREPEAILPYLTVGAAPALTLVRAFIRSNVGVLPDAACIEPAALEAACEAVTRLAHSFALTPMRDDVPTEGELREIARRMILPLLTSA